MIVVENLANGVVAPIYRAAINEFLQTKFDAHVHPMPTGQVTAPPHPAVAGAQMPETLLSGVVKAK